MSLCGNLCTVRFLCYLHTLVGHLGVEQHNISYACLHGSFTVEEIALGNAIVCDVACTLTA